MYICTVKTKLRKIGNSLGITIPSGELKALGATSGDLLEVELVRVIPAVRSDWDDPKVWQLDSEEQLLIDVENEFDETEWEW